MDSNFFMFPVEQKDMWYKLDKVWPGWPFMGDLRPVYSFLLREDLSADVPSRRWKVDVSSEMGGSFPLSAQQAKGHTCPGEEALNIPWTECLSDKIQKYIPLWWVRPRGLVRFGGFSTLLLEVSCEVSELPTDNLKTSIGMGREVLLGWDYLLLGNPQTH